VRCWREIQKWLLTLKSRHLSGNLLTGSIPESLGMLSALQVLCAVVDCAMVSEGLTIRDRQISSNQLTGSIPDSFGNLTNLVTLCVVRIGQSLS
jgi:hypothetical protein